MNTSSSSGPRLQLRALIRLGDQDYFWEIVDEALAEKFQHLLSAPITAAQWDPLPLDIEARLAMVRSADARERLPVLEQRFGELELLHQMNVVAMQPAAYFVPAVRRFLSEAWSYRVGEQAGQLLVQHAPFLTVETLDQALSDWAANPQCREAAQMPELAVALFRSTGHLGPGQASAFVTFLATVQSLASEGDSYYRYPSLEGALRAAGHVQ